MGERRKKEGTTGIEERLYVDESRPDRTSHIDIVRPDACPECAGRECVAVCPSGTYRWSEEQGRIQVSFENCLECGSCRIVCPRSNVSWRYPMGGMGICYRYG
ncbi:MAG: 4Fe-4S dicluster domain-containing protein [Deltaproteobacteria bacterium]|nr:4Fe-4S dicluster domain-containing protein [Deltaproteobacteria bacterium]